jgi:hypothetical protein
MLLDPAQRLGGDALIEASYGNGQEQGQEDKGEMPIESVSENMVLWQVNN